MTVAPRVGLGYDIHRLAAGRRLVLGGVAIEHPTGLVGHSDGDVLLHAVMDAVLGAAGLGDLGSHFPSDDPRYKDADSRELLRRIGSEVREAGYSIVSLDATIVAQAPRLDSHVAAMKSAIARGLQLPLESVSLKAKTSDGIGAIGAGEAIAAIAVALATK
jgi:2-C-methyl-D-erythritol 2,4-cyclodiphosphate synthase